MSQKGQNTTPSAVMEYLGHRIELTEAGIIVYTPWGVEMLRCESIARARLAIRRSRRMSA